MSSALRRDVDEQPLIDLARGVALPRWGTVGVACDEIDACTTVDAVRAWLQRFARRAGFYAGRYVHLGHGRAVAERGVPARPARTLSTVARERTGCDAQDWTLFDPVRDSARTAVAPFAWSTQLTPRLSDRQRTWLNMERARGVAAGIAVPVQDHAAGPAYLSLFGTDEAEARRLLETRGRELAYVGAQFHALAKTLVPPDGDGQVRGALTAREIECLSFAAQGSTVTHTALALGVAERTIEFHLANAAEKLCAVNKTHAVARAIGQRLITL